jgi:hypothetical protein
MPFSHLPPLLTSTFSCLSSWLHKRSALRLPRLLLGVLFATGRYRHLLVPRHRNHRRLPPGLHHRLRRRPPRPAHGR